MLRCSTNTINLLFILLPEVRRHHHNLLGGTLRLLAWPHTTAPAHTKITLTHGRVAHAATIHYTCRVPCGQVCESATTNLPESFFSIVRNERI